LHAADAAKYHQFSVPERVGVTFRNEVRVRPYEAALKLVGLVPVRLGVSPSITLRDLDGLVLTGGPDLDPMTYGEERGPATQEPDADRDQFETKLAAEGLRTALPILAICRGMQLVNVLRGGTLIQDLPTRSDHYKPGAGQRSGRHAAVHPIEIRTKTCLAGILGRESLEVNSRHHQGLARLGTGVEPAATAPDGVVEAVQLAGNPAFLGLQWHPEDRVLASPEDRALFAWFAESVASFAQGRINHHA
jgi:putative glutamine amidotransferase